LDKDDNSEESREAVTKLDIQFLEEALKKIDVTENSVDHITELLEDTSVTVKNMQTTDRITDTTDPVDIGEMSTKKDSEEISELDFKNISSKTESSQEVSSATTTGKLLMTILVDDTSSRVTEAGTKVDTAELEKSMKKDKDGWITAALLRRGTILNSDGIISRNPDLLEKILKEHEEEEAATMDDSTNSPLTETNFSSNIVTTQKVEVNSSNLQANDDVTEMTKSITSQASPRAPINENEIPNETAKLKNGKNEETNVYLQLNEKFISSTLKAPARIEVNEIEELDSKLANQKKNKELTYTTDALTEDIITTEKIISTMKTSEDDEFIEETTKTVSAPQDEESISNSIIETEESIENLKKLIKKSFTDLWSIRPRPRPVYRPDPV